jgi:hypothetical protein
MNKTIVTHISPDLDAITSSWLIKRYLPGWDQAEHAFVGAGSTLNGMKPDEDPHIIHVDTGMGKFDHHQTDAYTSATQIVYKYLVQENHIATKLQPALERLVDFVNDIDHFAEARFPEPTADRYEFLLSSIIDGMKPIIPDNTKQMEHIFPLLDAVLQNFRNKVRAEEDIKQGFIQQTGWGKALVMETKNEEAVKVALKMGYVLVMRKDPERGFVRIKTFPDKKYDLTSIYEQVIKLDTKATWFLHASKNMLLNGSSKNPNTIPSTLTTQQLIEIIKKM